MASREPETGASNPLETGGIHVAIVGAGIGGLACAIACRRANPPLQVTVLERTPEILTIGAGIHIPPNACRVLARFGLLEKLKQAGGYEVQDFTLRRYKDGQILAEKPLKDRMTTEYGAQWIGDYQKALLEETLAVGADVMTSAEVTGVISSTDGLWSPIREVVLEHPFPPEETGDLAYRGTFTRDELKGLENETLNELLEKSNIQVWLGENRHAVFYPLRDHSEVADDLPSGVRTLSGSVEEMAANFEGWDPILSDMISCLKTALKWKLLHFKELDQWTKGTIALLGDASHPTLPYQGQGAAMAVEDGAILGLLLEKFQGAEMPSNQTEKNARLASLLRLYEDLRKKRTVVNVAGAVHTRHFYHLADGPEQRERDRELAGLPLEKWQGSCSFNWGDAQYQKSLLGFDVLADAGRRFDEWLVALRGSAHNTGGS
ncbi:related to salicylate hydroxylase [Cephalotrichum gorgonifer]|uniref:Related to salicylate hydroxylase n=1 Tax=Cephalotrichum gorgonifer TaxID=2041049 RepID=A0AAE8N2J9_9PEZI|nr:related to salicylate hydroxylase [Cephalotrichum gorgonifer]